jgi:UDP-GlcNAc:undecaprenyl-phosphate/decaprenyl-phosphate GlcNAc-1-phosphate transferase
MLSVIPLALLSFALSLLFTPLLRNLARRCGWVDQPDNHRRTHRAPTPRLGGLAIVLAYAGSFGIFILALPASPLIRSFALSRRIALPIAVIFVVGLLDDFFDLKAREKLLGQTFAAILACSNGIQIESLGGGWHVSSYVGVPLTIIWLVGCTNAFNLIDGLDGLASGLGLVGALTALAAGLLYDDARLVTAMAPLAGVLLGFLIFNFNPASIFLGDCGSLWIGFMLGCYAVIWLDNSTTTLGALAPLVALCVPLLDTTLSIARRFLRRYPIFRSDRGHIHHRLLDRGLTARGVACVLYAAAGLAACVSLLQSVPLNGAGSLGIGLLPILACVGIKYLRYEEFGIAARLLSHNRLRSLVKSHVVLRDLEGSLLAAATVEECGRAIGQVGSEFGFGHLELRLGGRAFHEQLDPSTAPSWLLHIQLSDSEYVRLMCKFELSNAGTAIAPLTDLLHRTLSAKAVEFSTQPSLDRRKPMAQATSPVTRKQGGHIRLVGPQI